jgi:hypothetical protein
MTQNKILKRKFKYKIMENITDSTVNLNSHGRTPAFGI